ncbi:hypothetical protein [Streptomyces sp. NPDC059398]|uniref:hypothetical protein n=1 Tax=Streptomyces sp. NPDC059398 TaxID=3346820 RepID=UPI0036A1362A
MKKIAARRLAAVAVTGAALLAGAVAMAPGAAAAASSCSHDWSGPQICISTTGRSGSTNPGHVYASWTNPSKSRKSATVYLTEPGAAGHKGWTHKLTAHRQKNGQIVASYYPERQMYDGKLCARFKGSSHTACVDLIER